MLYQQPTAASTTAFHAREEGICTRSGDSSAGHIAERNAMYSAESKAGTHRWSPLARELGQVLIQCWLLLAVVLGSGHAMAQSMITGTINTTTTLRAAQSPYLFQGDVVLDNNATLSIEPGVTIQMAAASSFTLKKGALQALGTPSQPITITSAATTPAAGDWRQWRFTAGTNNALTQLGYVTIEYGSGVAVEGASPVINNTAINQHSGPAITIDLASSPAGTGNTANGNSLNAISVPSGTIRAQVVWGLVGIPYLVQQGLVNIGQAPLTLEPSKLKLSPGVVALLRVTLNAPAPAGSILVDVTSSVPSVASAVSRVTIPEGQTSADLEIQASSLGTTMVTASHATLGFAETQVEVVNLPSLGLAPASPTVGVNRNYPMTLSLPAPAVSNVAVQISNADAAVLSAPTSLVVPAGQQSVTFEVTGLVDGVSRLAAQAEGYASALATVTVRGKALVLPSSVVVAPGGTTIVTIEATEPAPAGGLSVGLTLAQSSLAQAPASVQIPAGQTKASFTITGATLGTTTLTAVATGYQSGQTTLQVDAISLNTDPAADLVMNVELSRTVRVQLSKTAPQGGITVAVVSQDPAIAAVSPAEVFIPQGQIYATVPVTIKALAEGKTVLSITSPGLIAKTLGVDVKQKFALKLVLQSGTKIVVGKGLTTYGSEVRVLRLLNGVVSAGAEPVVVNLRCVATDVCTTPATVTIPANQYSISLKVSGVEVGSTQLEATADGATSATPMPVEVVTPTMVFSSLDGTRSTSSIRDDFSISLQVPGAYYSNSQTATSPIAVHLGLTDQSPAGVVNGIYNQASGGSLLTQLMIGKDSNGTATAYIAQPSAAGTYRLSAEAVDVVGGKSEIQTVTAAQQALQLMLQRGTKIVVGKGLTTYGSEVRVQRLLNGVVSAGAEPVVVNLRCVATDVCTTPATVTIPANQYSISLKVSGVEVGSTQLEATADGATSATPMPVEVVTPTMVFSSLDGTRSTSSIRDDFSISLQVPGAYYSNSQTATSPIAVHLGLTDQSPAGVVNGIYNQASGGSLLTQLMIGKDSNGTATAYIAQPSAAGTYRLSAEVVDVVSGKSEIQTVTAAQQALQLVRQSGTKIVVGKGLTTYGSEVRVQRLLNGVVSVGAEPVVVNLRCVATDVCTTPATVTIPANQYSISLKVSGVEVGSTQLEATAVSHDAGYLNVETVTPNLRLQNAPSSISVGKIHSSVYVGTEVAGAYYSNSQTSNAAFPITFTSSVPSVGTVTGTVNWAANAGNSGYATFTAIAPGTTQITASSRGFTPVTSAVITVNP
ncbi:hypothetical protein [Comamonas sp.]|uniref:hypothetical protein n=1 Tax=Comamonas sp. TaxID=34028 RepID=UPI002FCAE6A7